MESAKRTKELQSALSNIHEAAMFARQFERTTELDGFGGGYGANGHIAGSGPEARSIVMRLPATTLDYRNSNREAVYTSSDTSHNCPD